MVFTCASQLKSLDTVTPSSLKASTRSITPDCIVRHGIGCLAREPRIISFVLFWLMIILLVWDMSWDLSWVYHRTVVSCLLIALTTSRDQRNIVDVIYHTLIEWGEQLSRCLRALTMLVESSDRSEMTYYVSSGTLNLTQPDKYRRLAPNVSIISSIGLPLGITSRQQGVVSYDTDWVINNMQLTLRIIKLTTASIYK